MYIPESFAEQDSQELYRIIQQHPLGILIRHHKNLGLDANHIPFLWEPIPGKHGVLRGHIARANDLWKTCPTGSKVFEIEITSLISKSKLSQNKDERDRLNAAKTLDARGNAALAERTRKVRT